MKKVIGLLFVAALAVAVPYKAIAGGYSDSPSCSESMLYGRYGLAFSGFSGTTAPFTPFVGERLVTFDGKGGLTAPGYRIEAGTISDTTATGTYTVSSDCDVKIVYDVFDSIGTLTDTALIYGVIVANGTKILAVKGDVGGALTLSVTVEKVWLGPTGTRPDK